ncbi:MAG: RipA family octameric membrane protein [Planctomycetota bacterium]|jgi:hypothetical protein
MTWKREDADTVRDMIKHESNVMNHRFTWLVTLHGLLFAALGFAWDDAGNAKGLIIVLAMLGITTSLSIMITLYTAHAAMVRLVKAWGDNKPSDYEGPDIIGYRGALPLPVAIVLPWVVIPVLLALAWAVVLIINV